MNIVNSLYSRHCRDHELESSLARVHNRRSLLYSWDLAAVRIMGVSVIDGCPQGESSLYYIIEYDQERSLLK